MEATDPHQTDVSARTLSDLSVNTEDSPNVSMKPTFVHLEHYALVL